MLAVLQKKSPAGDSAKQENELQEKSVAKKAQPFLLIAIFFPFLAHYVLATKCDILFMSVK